MWEKGGQDLILHLTLPSLPAAGLLAVWKPRLMKQIQGPGGHAVFALGLWLQRAEVETSGTTVAFVQFELPQGTVPPRFLRCNLHKEITRLILLDVDYKVCRLGNC